MKSVNTCLPDASVLYLLNNGLKCCPSSSVLGFWNSHLCFLGIRQEKPNLRFIKLGEKSKVVKCFI